MQSNAKILLDIIHSLGPVFEAVLGRPWSFSTKKCFSFRN